MKNCITFLLALLSIGQCFSQKNQKEFIQLEGKVINMSNMEPIRSAHILIQHQGGGTITNVDGLFRIELIQADSIHISAIGFKAREISISDSLLHSPHPFLPIAIQSDTIQIDEVEIFPYDDYATFKYKVINTPLEPLPFINNPMFQEFDAYRKIISTYRKGGNPQSMGPTQLIYNMFNSKVSLSKKLIRNRRRINRQNKKLGLPLIPTLPPNMQEPRSRYDSVRRMQELKEPLRP